MQDDTTVLFEQVVGRGQVQPGPSRLHLRGITLSLVALVILTVSVPAQFLFGTLLVGRVEEIPTAATVSLVLGAVLMLWAGFRAPAPPFRHAAALLMLGLLVGSVVPLLLLYGRHSDAPSGTVVAFWTMTLPGMLVLLAGTRRVGAARLTALAFSLAAGAGAMGILGNWERPSSFSLLSRYVPEQVGLGLASLLWVLCMLAMVWFSRRHGTRMVARYVGFGSLIGTVSLTILAGGPVALAASFAHTNTLIYALSGAVIVLVVLLSLSKDRAALAASGMLLAPTMISLLIFVEAAIGVLGPEPILRAPVVWGSMLVATALITAWIAEEIRPEWRPPRKARRLLTALAMVALLCAVVGLLAPGVGVSVEGRLVDSSRFVADFEMRGFETVGGLLALVAALIAVVTSVRSMSRRLALGAVSTVLVAVGAHFAMGFTPLHTWVSWIPADVQQDYGTEYARIVFGSVLIPWQLAALGCAGVVTVGIFIEIFLASGQRIID